MQRVTAAIIKKNSKILIAKRKKGDHFEDLWEFPGGKLEPEETPEDCLKRELFEELGIEIRVGNFLCSIPYETPSLSIELLAYEADIVSGEFKIADHQEIKWVLTSELENHDFTKPDLLIVKKLKEDRDLKEK